MTQIGTDWNRDPIRGCVQLWYLWLLRLQTRHLWIEAARGSGRLLTAGGGALGLRGGA